MNRGGEENVKFVRDAVEGTQQGFGLATGNSAVVMLNLPYLSGGDHVNGTDVLRSTHEDESVIFRESDFSSQQA